MTRNDSTATRSTFDRHRRQDAAQAMAEALMMGEYQNVARTASTIPRARRVRIPRTRGLKFFPPKSKGLKMQHELLSPADFRAILKISKRTFIRWKALKLLPIEVAPSRWTRRQIDDYLTRFDEQEDSPVPFNAK